MWTWSGPRIVGTVLVCLVALLALGLAVAQDQETLRVESAIAADDPRSPEYLAAMIGAAVSYGDTYEVLVDAEEIFHAMLAAIDRAQHRISFETYVYEEGRVADRFTAALERAARRGVEVRIIIDLIGAAAMADSHMERLRSAGADVIRLNAPRWYELEEVNYRTHRKILVVDGGVGFCGGVGVSDYWLYPTDGQPPWRDTHVMIRGPIVRLLEAAFYDNLIESGRMLAPVLAHPDAAQREANAASILVRGAPTGGANDLKKTYLLMLAMARQSIDVVTPYFIVDESTMWAIGEAARRGVRIRLLVEGDLTDARPVKYASRHAYERLMELGVEVYEYQPTMMHAKVLIVDGVWSMFGSANFDNRSLELNDELNIAVFSPELASRFERDLVTDLAHSKRLVLEKWRQRPRADRVREYFWSYFGEVF